MFNTPLYNEYTYNQIIINIPRFLELDALNYKMLELEPLNYKELELDPITYKMLELEEL